MDQNTIMCKSQDTKLPENPLYTFSYPGSSHLCKICLSGLGVKRDENTGESVERWCHMSLFLNPNVDRSQRS